MDVEGGTLCDADQLLNNDVLGADVSVELVFFPEAVEEDYILQGTSTANMPTCSIQ